MPKLFITDDNETVEIEIDLANYDLKSAVDQFKLVDAIKEALLTGRLTPTDDPSNLAWDIQPDPFTEPQPKPEYEAEVADWDVPYPDPLDWCLYAERVRKGQQASP